MSVCQLDQDISSKAVFLLRTFFDFPDQRRIFGFKIPVAHGQIEVEHLSQVNVVCPEFGTLSHSIMYAFPWVSEPRIHHSSLDNHTVVIVFITVAIPHKSLYQAPWIGAEVYQVAGGGDPWLK